MLIGSALHAAVLEPDTFDHRYVAAPPCSAMLAKGGRCRNAGRVAAGGDWFCGVHAPEGAGVPDGLTILAAEQLEQVRRMADAVRCHPAAFGVLGDAGNNEVSARWDLDVPHDDGRYSLACKGRADALRPTWDAIVDLKTTASAAPSEFERSIATFGYHRQAAWYVDGLNRLGGAYKHFVIIAVENTAPYGVAVYRLMGEAIDAGRAELEPLVKTIAACERLNHWWGYASEFQDISLPTWRMRQIFKQA